VGLQFTAKDGKVLSVNFRSDGAKCIKGGMEVPCQVCAYNGRDLQCSDNVGFPLDFINIITFLLLGYIAMQFYNYVIDMAQDISGAAVSLEIGSPVASFVNNVAGRVDQAVAAVAKDKEGDPARAALRAGLGSDLGGDNKSSAETDKQKGPR